MRMFSFIKKDKILRKLSKPGIRGCSSEKLAVELNIKHYIVYSLCYEMELRGHVKNIETSTISSEYYTCDTSILPAGKYFIDNGGYVWEWIKTAIIDFPKNFWWIIAIFTFWAGKNFECGRKKVPANKIQSQQTQLKYYKETPEFIKKYLDGINDGKFLIAEPGERWNSGCIHIENNPSRLFVSATITDNKYKMTYLTGGIFRSMNMIIINFKGEDIISYATDNKNELYYPF